MLAAMSGSAFGVCAGAAGIFQAKGPCRIINIGRHKHQSIIVVGQGQGFTLFDAVDDIGDHCRHQADRCGVP